MSSPDEMGEIILLIKVPPGSWSEEEYDLFQRVAEEAVSAKLAELGLAAHAPSPAPEAPEAPPDVPDDAPQ